MLTIAGTCVTTVVWLFTTLVGAGGEYDGGGLIIGWFPGWYVCPWCCAVLGADVLNAGGAAVTG